METKRQKFGETKLPGKQEEKRKIEIQTKAKDNRLDYNRKRTRDKEIARLKT